MEVVCPACKKLWDLDLKKAPWARPTKLGRCTCPKCQNEKTVSHIFNPAESQSEAVREKIREMATDPSNV
jgi:ssDNA-binding Zn-finger/Zn-ribbon topoisomerase 1